MPDDSYYDEDLDSPMAAPGAQDDEEKEGDYGESFLAPKASFPDGVEVGSTHKVRVEAIRDNEVELKCVGKDDQEPAPTGEEESLYE